MIIWSWPLIAPSPDADAPIRLKLLTEAMELALKRAGLSHKQACAFMGLDPSQWSRERAAGTFRFDRLTALPHAFWQEFWPLAAEAVQVDLPIHPALAKVQDGIRDLKRRLARMALAPVTPKERVS